MLWPKAVLAGHTGHSHHVAELEQHVLTLGN